MKKIIIGSVSVAIICITILISVFSVTKFNGNNKVTYTKHCTNIEVQKGDTLWDYAQKYAIDSSDYNSYISEVKKLNNIIDDNIQQGQKIIIIYYEEN